MHFCKICKKPSIKGNGSFFSVKNEDRRLKWSQICGINFHQSDVVCVDHFSTSHIVNAGKKPMLLPHAVPIMPESGPAAVFPTFPDTVQKIQTHEVFMPTETAGSNFNIFYAEPIPRVVVFTCALCQKKCQPDTGKYFKVPEDEARRKLWSESCRWPLLPDSVVCQDHFSSKSFMTYKNQLLLMPNAVPLPPRLSKEQIEANIGGQEIMIDDDNRSEISVNIPINSSHLLAEDPLNLNKAPFMEQREPSKQYVNKEIQTDPFEGYNRKYVSKCRQLETEIKELKLQIMKSNMAMNSIYKIFTEGQIRKLMYSREINWRDHDMENALELYKCGSRAYKYLYKKGFPLPHISSLQRWKRKNASKNINLPVPPNKNIEETEDDDEVNDFSGDDNDWFDDFYEEETVNNDKINEENNIVTNTENELIEEPQQHENRTANIIENREKENKMIPDPRVILSVPSQYASPDLNAIITASNAKFFIAKKPTELENSQEQNLPMISDTSKPKPSVFNAATNARSLRDMPDLNSITPVQNIEGNTIDGEAGKQGTNEIQNVIIIGENQGESLDYNEFLKSLNSGGYLIDES